MKANKYAAIIVLSLFLLPLIANAQQLSDALYKEIITAVNKKLEAEKEKKVSPEEFFKAVKNGDAAKVKEFLKAKADPDIKDKGGNTALMWAASQGHKEIVEILLKAKADPNIKNSKGRTALTAAAYFGH